QVPVVRTPFIPRTAGRRCSDHRRLVEVFPTLWAERINHSWQPDSAVGTRLMHGTLPAGSRLHHFAPHTGLAAEVFGDGVAAERLGDLLEGVLDRGRLEPDRRERQRR